jgi:hypothetical protein
MLLDKRIYVAGGIGSMSRGVLPLVFRILLWSLVLLLDPAAFWIYFD